MLTDLVAPERLRAGDPQALAALCAVAGWPVVRYCELAGAGEETARAVVVAFATFRRRAVTAGAVAGVDHDRLLLDCAREAVEELRGAEADGDVRRAAEEGFAIASPRPLSARLATAVLRALVEAAPLSGDRRAVREQAERSYADAYAAAAPAPPVPGEARLPAASVLLGRAAAAGPAAPATGQARRSGRPAGPARVARSGLAAGRRPRPSRPRTIAIAGLAVAALIALALVVALGTGDDGERAAAPVTPPPAPQVVRGLPGTPLTASAARFEVVPIRAAPWARRLRSRPLPAGRRWVTIAVRVRNVDRTTLPLRGLGYRLRTSAGIVVGPLTVDLPAALERTDGRLAVGERASVHLGFAPPRRAGGLTLFFEPGGMSQPTVVVPLGARP